MDLDSFNFNKGTVEFWVKANKLEWNNNKNIELFKVSREEGKILIFKNKKNFLVGIYQKGKDQAEVSVDVSELSSQKKHQVVLSWHYEHNEVSLCLDGEQVSKSNIK